MSQIETEVIVTLGRSLNHRSDASWWLRVKDKRSGLEVLELRMDNDTFADMMSSTDAGRTAQAEITSGEPAQNLGKYRVHHSEIINIRGVDYKERDTFLREQGELLARDMRRDTGKPWKFTHYTGGGGGSPNRTLSFVYYTDEKPEGR